MWSPGLLAPGPQPSLSPGGVCGWLHVNLQLFPFQAQRLCAVRLLQPHHTPAGVLLLQ